jgi:hypothetical protein
MAWAEVALQREDTAGGPVVTSYLPLLVCPNAATMLSARSRAAMASQSNAIFGAVGHGRAEVRALRAAWHTPASSSSREGTTIQTMSLRWQCLCIGSTDPARLARWWAGLLG